VEDHGFQRSGLVSLLRAIGVQHVQEAANGREALAMLESGRERAPPDVILCDLEMPEVDGIEFLRIVAQRKLAHAVIIISAREPEILASVEAMVRSLGLTVLGKLGKPVAPESLWGILSSDPDAFRPAAGRVRAFDTMEMRRGIEAGEFQCEYQPKVRFDTGRMVGVEALARWRRPGAAAVGPAEFVPAMVLTGLITPLTTRMLDAVSRALNEWDRQGLALTAAVNVSMSTLADLATADRFAAQVQGHGIDPRRITFEVTETEVMSDVATVLTVLARLRLKGFQLAIDDFGTGYASLAQLNAIPFTELKIDQTFVRNCGQSPRLRNIVRSSIDLAHRLNLRTVAEGIESREEWDFLRLSACDEGQGYYVARPMLEDEIPDHASRPLRHLADDASAPPAGARS
jgi:EAL domain-containing protein (putative c-di-GMP-specific phosphodiesterase class I)